MKIVTYWTDCVLISIFRHVSSTVERTHTGHRHSLSSIDTQNLPSRNGAQHETCVKKTLRSRQIITVLRRTGNLRSCSTMHSRFSHGCSWCTLVTHTLMHHTSFCCLKTARSCVLAVALRTCCVCVWSVVIFKCRDGAE